MLTLSNVQVNLGIFKTDFTFSWPYNKKKIGVIGPNGSGKSTFFKLLSGFLKPFHGSIVFNNKKIHTLEPHERNLLGIASTFQIPKPFKNFNAYETIYVSAIQKSSKEEAINITNKLITHFGIHDDAPPLALVQLRLLEIAKAIASKPKFLLLDEVLTGLRNQEIPTIFNILKDIDIPLLIIDHNIKALVDFCDYMIVIFEGKILFQGSTYDCLNHPKVKEIYLN